MPTKNEYPHHVDFVIGVGDFPLLLPWLREHGHEIRQTMVFGKNHAPNSSTLHQRISFRDADAAMLFKLTWGGQ